MSVLHKIAEDQRQALSQAHETVDRIHRTLFGVNGPTNVDPRTSPIAKAADREAQGAVDLAIENNSNAGHLAAKLMEIDKKLNGG